MRWSGLCPSGEEIQFRFGITLMMICYFLLGCSMFYLLVDTDVMFLQFFPVLFRLN